MNEERTEDHKKLTLEEVYAGQSDALTEMSDLIVNFSACIKTLAENYILLKQRVEQLEKEVNKK